MIGDINQFRTQGLPQGGARPNLFEIYLPAAPNVVSAINVSDAPLRCTAATLPQFRLISTDVYYQGRPIPMVTNRQFLPWTARFLNEVDFGLRDFFEAWNNRANTLVGNQTEVTDFLSAVNGGYQVDGMIVRNFSKQLGLLRSYEFFGAYPETVGDIELNWQNANQIETFDVTFRYAYFIPSISDGDQAFPATYDVEGQSPGFGPGSVPLNVVGAAAAPINAVTAPGTPVTPVSILPVV